MAEKDGKRGILQCQIAQVTRKKKEKEKRDGAEIQLQLKSDLAD